MSDNFQSYRATDIQVLEDLDAVRRRPGLFIGSTDQRGLHQLVYELVNNSVDEAMASTCDRIEVTIHKDSSVTVEDNGRGIPVGIHPETEKSALEVVHTTLHSGAKFDNHTYKVAGGLHGVGVACVNALSDWLSVEVKRNGKLYRQSYHRGEPTGPVEAVGKAKGVGTKTTFLPDRRILETLDYDFDTLAQRFREMAFLNRGLEIKFVDEREERETNFYFEGGITSFVRYLNKGREVLHPEPVAIEQQVEDSFVEAALQWRKDDYKETVYSFANGVHTIDGGTHVTGFRSALTRVINDYARSKRLLKSGEEKFTGEDVRSGLTVVLSVKLTEPQFESQTKAKLGNSGVRFQVESAIAEGLLQFLENNTREAKRIVKKCRTAARGRRAAQKARSLIVRKSTLEVSGLPGKLADCAEKDPEKSELFIVEGDSAGGCFAPETLVRLASGETKSMCELAIEWERGVLHFGYAVNEESDVRIVPLRYPRLTRRDAELVEVVLDNGKRIHCTPDHLFRLRGGSYREALHLKPGDSLMPLMLEAASNINHRVRAVRPLQERSDVYDITVDHYQNFALAAGVFVHNSAKQGRDRRFQAILPLRGKILNTEKHHLNKILANKELKALIAALGVGAGREFDLGRLRYGKVIITTDADVDGAHIRTLLLTFFFRYMRPLIEGGYLYIAQPPLYRIENKGDVRYAYTDEEKERILADIDGKVNLQRYKGLGEMNPEQLWETTMDPQNRTLLRVTIGDAAKADRVFEKLMGPEVPPRRRFIQTHAKEVKNLDI